MGLHSELGSGHHIARACISNFRATDPHRVASELLGGIFEMALERLGVQPSEMIFVYDHAAVFASAVELGIHCIEFKDTAQTIADIEACIKANA